MGLPVTVYRHSDLGAPQLTNRSPSELINILKKCLVEGYGDKNPLGWTLEYEDVGSVAAAFRNDPVVGSGGYVKVYSATGADGTGVNFRMKVAKSMMDINTFIDDTGFKTYDLDYSQQGGAWQVIGTSRGFWLIIEHLNKTDYTFISSSYQQWQITVFIGDIDTCDPNDSSPFIQISGNNTTASDITYSTYTYVFGGNSTAYCGMYSCDGSPSSQTTYKLSFPFICSTTTVTGNQQSQGISEILLPVGVYIDAYSYVPTLAFPSSRGVIPGLFQSGMVAYSDQTRPLDLTFDGELFTRIHCYQMQNLWINLEAWYG